ncbi:sigma-70 family RNA polymerase sigma factor [Mycobacterium sp. C31M]
MNVVMDEDQEVSATGETRTELAARFERETRPLHPVLMRGARRLTRIEADAEDLLQDALMHAFMGFHRFEPGTNLNAWLFRILHNRWISGYRMKQRRPAEYAVESIAELDLPARTVHACSAEATALDCVPDAEIKAALEQLPEGFRTALYYADVQGLTYAETADVMGTPIGTVMSRVFRARTQLRAALAGLAQERGMGRLEKRSA